MSLCFVSMKEILERHNLHSKNLSKLEQPSLELQVSFFSFLYFFKIWVTFSWHGEYDFDYYFWILLDLPFFICDEKEYVFFSPLIWKWICMQLVENSNFSLLSKEVAEKSHKLRFLYFFTSFITLKKHEPFWTYNLNIIFF